MHSFRRAVSRLQISSISSPSSIIASRAVPRSTCSTSMLSATRFTYPTITQTRWNSNDAGDGNFPIKYVESLPEGRTERERRPKFVNEGPQPKSTLYIGNLFFDVTAEDLRAKFETFGTVENALIVHDARGLSKGFGYVTFSSVEEATEAITQLHGGLYEGRHVVVQFANTTTKSMGDDRKPSKTLYVGNIPYELTDQDLQEIFAELQGVTDVRIPIDRRTGLPRGFGHIDFIDESQAAAAKEIIARKAPYGRKLYASFATRKVLTPEDHARHQEKKMLKRNTYQERKAQEYRKSSHREVRGVREVGELGEIREVQQKEVEQNDVEQKPGAEQNDVQEVKEVEQKEVEQNVVEEVKEVEQKPEAEQKVAQQKE